MSLHSWRSRLGLLAIIALALSCDGGRLPGVPSPVVPPVPTGLVCGVERWSVKTLSDPDATSVDFTVQHTTIRALNQLPARCHGGPDRRAYPEEFAVYEVAGRITHVTLQDDRDYHVVLADPDEPSFTMVTEVANPACQGVVSSPFLSVLQSTRADFDQVRAGRPLSALVGERVRVRGVGFFDFNHNQIGRAHNCMELHPLVGIARLQ